MLGEVDRQRVLPRGTPDEVRAEVRADIDAFAARSGGLIAHGKIGGDVPLENIEAMLHEMVLYGAGICRRPSEPNH